MRALTTVGSEDESDRFGDTPHPRHATRLIGHDDHQRDILVAYRQNRLPQALIVTGQAGIGKATLAWRLVRFLLSQPEHGSNNDRTLTWDDGSKGVAQVEALAHPDLVLLRREVNDKAKRFFTDIRADDVRRAIGLFQRAPAAGGYRICVVDSADDLNRSSANALLKLIEEPPPRSLFLLVSHRPGLILPTIRSRSRLLRLASLDAPSIASVVRSLGEPWSTLEGGAVNSAAAEAQGSVHGALRRLDRSGSELETGVIRLLDRLPHIEWREVHRLADQVAGRDGEAAFLATMTSIYDWIAHRVREGAGGQARRLAPYAEVWEKIAAAARETDALNLDRRPLILTIFSDLAAAVRASSA